MIRGKTSYAWSKKLIIQTIYITVQLFVTIFINMAGKKTMRNTMCN